jgi:hypothetical protein
MFGLRNCIWRVSDMNDTRQQNRDRMPIVAGWVDDLRAAMVAKTGKADFKVTYASEGGVELGRKTKREGN